MIRLLKSYSQLAHQYIIYSGLGRVVNLLVETLKELEESSVDVYDPSSEQIKNLEIYGEKGLFFMSSYKECLLLLDHSDSRLYYYNN
nr:hypothetical protein [Tanacetum cinerariifolium]